LAFGLRGLNWWLDLGEGADMSINFGAGLHVATGRAVDASSYDRYIGRWSRLFVPTVLAAAEISPGYRVLDISTGTGEASSMALPIVGAVGLVIGADISPEMLKSARKRLDEPSFCPVAADGQALPFKDGVFDAVICHLGLQFFLDPACGVSEFRRVLRAGRRAAACVISSPERAPMWGVLADVVSRYFPEQRRTLHLSFALADQKRLEQLLIHAGFREVRVELQTREDSFESFDDYWAPIEAGIGTLPQAYLALNDAKRHEVREEVKARLSKFETNGRLSMSVEMLIGSGRV
jgi:ubiquinone/menaquinone biosynthesis C-methylase UbiE